VIHCSCDSEASRSVPIVRSATLTTVPSSSVSPDPRVAAATIPRPVGVPHWIPVMVLILHTTADDSACHWFR